MARILAGESYISRPSEVFRTFLTERGAKFEGYEYGMLAMALEILTVVKTIEALPLSASSQARSETISTLWSLLQDLEIDEYTETWYERLNEWRKPRVVAIAGETGPVESADDADERQPHLVQASELGVSVAEALQRRLAPPDSTDALEQTGPDLAPASDEMAQLIAGADSATLIGVDALLDETAVQADETPASRSRRRKGRKHGRHR